MEAAEVMVQSDNGQMVDHRIYHVEVASGYEGLFEYRSGDDEHKIAACYNALTRWDAGDGWAVSTYEYMRRTDYPCFDRDENVIDIREATEDEIKEFNSVFEQKRFLLFVDFYDSYGVVLCDTYAKCKSYIEHLTDERYYVIIYAEPADDKKKLSEIKDDDMLYMSFVDIEQKKYTHHAFRVDYTKISDNGLYRIFGMLDFNMTIQIPVEEIDKEYYTIESFVIVSTALSVCKNISEKIKLSEYKLT